MMAREEVEVGGASLPGNRYGELNQDSFVCQKLPAAEEGKGGITAAVVLDGHGMLGDVAAKQAGLAMMAELHERRAAAEKLAELPAEEQQSLMKALFQAGHQAALRSYEDPPETIVYPRTPTVNLTYHLQQGQGITLYKTASTGDMLPSHRLLELGATCTMALVAGGRLLVADVGDSAAVMGSIVEGELRVQQLTQRHWGRNQLEAQRLRQLDCSCTELGKQDGYLTVMSGPLAGYELSVTRALGHKHMQPYGVIPEPYVRTVELKPEDICVVLASDGVWEVMDGEEAVSRVLDALGEGRSAQQAAEQLVRDAVHLAQCSPTAEADNTTAVVIVLK